MRARWLAQLKDLTPWTFRPDLRSFAGLDGERPKGSFVLRKGKEFAGTHLLVDFFQATNLDHVDRIKIALTEAAHAAHATLLQLHLHRFTEMGGGVSGVAVLAESHISIHTWPGYGYAALDLFMCGSSNPYLSIPVLRQALSPKRVKVHEFLRGEVDGADIRE
jgi:S-adenosylmethionine decarboxylase